ncbi:MULTISPECIES: hypothetical protein [Bradyrhizobium]|uniref:hypothetical protein n=1 Tax=Bradyrhizobium TaxID=374 RepID=UPI001008EEF2|nr:MULTISPECIES: hypothetical protein [Bradyrhizobium]MDA9400903.1 hypothetical protein [Bradyrhizobium sp. CCBAU 45389]MDA9527293.1 hypothetical protein [Bradyrhizobium sp. CCBAU 25338]RXH33320.1 hypothetical protein XH84_10125 [Bradyrhizobium nanningense]
MAVLFKTNSPKALLNDFKDKIDKGHVVTWSYDKDGDFTHTPDQWRNVAWMRPSIDLGGLRFNILGSTKTITTKAIYGVFHGRLVESLVTHSQHLFTDASTTALATNSDHITTKVA